MAQAQIKQRLQPHSTTKEAPLVQKGATARPTIALTPTGAAAPTVQWRADLLTEGNSKGSQSAPAITVATL